MISDPANEDIRTLFDWRKTPTGDTLQLPVGNDDLALALQLLSCNPRDRAQFLSGSGSGTVA